MENLKAKKLFWLILILPLLLALLNLRFLWLQCFNPSDTSNPESMVVFFAERVASGKSLFLDYHQPPYILIQYTPFYHWLLGKAAGSFDFNREEIFIAGRIFLLGCTLVIGLLLYLKARSEEEEFPLAISGTLFFLSSYILWPWAVTNRPDMLGAFLTLSGFLLYTQFAKSPVRWLSVLLFVLAFFAKQSFISAPFAVFVWLIANRKLKEGFLLTAVCAFLVLGILIAMHQATSGLSTMNLVDPNTGAPIAFQNLRLITLTFLQLSPLPVILAVTGAAHKGWRRPETIYFLVSLSFAILTSSKLGSNVNYFIEPLAAGCLLVPGGLRSLINLHPGTPRVFLATAFLVLMLPSINFMAHSLIKLRFSQESYVRKQITELEGVIITDNPRFALMSHRPFLLEPFPLSYMEKTGKWSSKEIVEMLQKHEVELVVLTLPVENPLSWQGFKRLPEPVLAGIEKYYRYDGTLDGYHLYLPKKKSQP